MVALLNLAQCFSMDHQACMCACLCMYSTSILRGCLRNTQLQTGGLSVSLIEETETHELLTLRWVNRFRGRVKNCISTNLVHTVVTCASGCWHHKVCNTSSYLNVTRWDGNTSRNCYMCRSLYYVLCRGQFPTRVSNPPMSNRSHKEATFFVHVCLTSVWPSGFDHTCFTIENR